MQLEKLTPVRVFSLSLPCVRLEGERELGQETNEFLCSPSLILIGPEKYVYVCVCGLIYFFLFKNVYGGGGVEGQCL